MLVLVNADGMKMERCARVIWLHVKRKHSTRGRARMFFEMMQGDVLKGGWKNEEVKESLDLCLSCKGCKGDCPVNVDMATYKSEFLIALL